MRRFEFVEGTSAKFWSGWVEDVNFIVEYGRIGTAGQRKAKPFADAAAAQRECDKKIAEKLREGYHEVTAGDGAAAPVAAKPKLVLPPRVRGVPAGGPSPSRVDAAVKALAALEGDVGGRSWSVAHHGRVARRALEALGGVDPGKVPALARGFDAVLALVTGAKGGRRLPLRIALELLSEVDVAAFERALAAWQKAADAPARAAIEAIATESQALGESELALRFAALVTDNAANDAGWSKRWKALAPHIEATLADKGSSVGEHAEALAASSDARVARRGAMLAQDGARAILGG